MKNGCQYRFEPLSGGLSVAVNETDRVCVDALLLAHFVGACDGAVCDLGTGCGVIPLRLLDRGACDAACGVDIRPGAVALLQAAIDRFSLHGRLSAVCADWSRLSMLPAGGFAVVTANPPYYKEGSGAPPADPDRRVMRFGAPDCFASLCAAASRLLADSGRLCVCVPPARWEDLCAAMRGAGLFVSRRRDVLSREGRTFLCLAEAVKRPVETAVLPPWDMTDSDFLKELYNE